MRVHPTCVVCGEQLSAVNRRRVYCSDACKRKNAGNTPRPNVTAIGAECELMAACELMRRGYYVYRALDPTAPFDLVAYRSDVGMVRVEVKSMGSNAAQFDRCDVEMRVNRGTGAIEYSRPLE
jgi:hypothetical protein